MNLPDGWVDERINDRYRVVSDGVNCVTLDYNRRVFREGRNEKGKWIKIYLFTGLDWVEKFELEAVKHLLRMAQTV